jgi:hypothetical protein
MKKRQSSNQTTTERLTTSVLHHAKRYSIRTLLSTSKVLLKPQNSWAALANINVKPLLGLLIAVILSLNPFFAKQPRPKVYEQSLNLFGPFENVINETGYKISVDS